MNRERVFQAARPPKNIDMNTQPTIERISKNDIAALFGKQKANAPAVGRTSYAERKKKLARMLDYLSDHEAEIRQATYADLRKPANEVMLSEIIVLTTELRYHMRHLRRWMKPHSAPGTLMTFGTESCIRYEPKGTALIISPWNYPVSLAIKPLISAVSAGCTAIIKPSEFTPNSNAFLKNFVSNLFNPEEVAVLEGDKEVASDLLELPFDHIFFTGSPAVGKVVMRAASAHLTSVSLELGGKSPALVDETADIVAAAKKIVWSKFLNNGQTCIAPDYVLAHRKITDRLLSEILKAIQAFYNPAGAGIHRSPDYARIINRKHFQRLKTLQEDALQNGAELYCGGYCDEDDLFFEPTVLTGIKPEMALMHEEIFGPLLPVISYDSSEEALARINAGPKPLALYLYSRNEDNIALIISRTSSGNALVNEALVQFQHPEVPFGGIQNSGLGKANGFFGFQEFSHPKGIIRRRFGTISFLYPPFSATTTKILTVIRKYF